MRRFIVLLLLSIISFSSYSQPCKEEKLKNKNKVLVLEGYIVQASLANNLTKDTGVVLLRRSVDPQGRDNWYLSTAQSDYVYKQAPTPPQSYYRIYDKIVLIWDDNRYQVMDSLQKQSIVDCLDKLVSNQLVHFEKGRWKEMTKDYALGNPPLNSEGKVYISNMPPSEKSAIIYVFNKEGTIYQRLAPL